MPLSPSSRAPLTLADLLADLVWPKLLRAGQLALRPSRLGMALVFIVGFMIVFSIADRQSHALSDALRQIGLDLGGLNVPGSKTPFEHIGFNLHEVFVKIPAALLRDHPLIALIGVPLLALWTALMGGAICRSAACDFAQGVSIDWPQAIGFAASRWMSLLLALALPLLIIWGIALALAIGGWVLFSWPALNVLGALLWVLFMFAGLIVSVLIFGYLVGAPMLVPSVACEGTDALDAVQHAYSFVFARPLRLVIYLFVLFWQGVLLTVLVAAMLWLAVFVAQWSAGAWSGDRGQAVLTGLQTGLPDPAPGSNKAAHWIVGLWTLLPLGLGLAFIVSYFWSASTVLYLAMRRLVDAQDTSEIWMPGVLEGTMARGGSSDDDDDEPGAAAGSEGVSDTDPADET